MSIKFRSWNEKEQKFYYFMDGKYYLDSWFRIQCGNTIDFDWKNAEQSTGNYDKNNNEIFENDIIIVGKYTTKDFTYTMKKHKWEWIAEQHNCGHSGIGSGYWGNDIEVIGNIHENKELLDV